MKISVNDLELFTLNDIQKRVICDSIKATDLEEDLKRRLQYSVMHKYEQCFKRLKLEWEPKLISNGVEMLPTNPDELAALIFAQPNYKDRSTREAELKAAESENV